MITVIVPVYKVEPYLDRCVQSIIDQSYKDLEIILVDDGSPDNCPLMCDAWAKKDCRIKVIHKENGGLSDARNAGLKAAAGEYIAFADSDDWIASNMYEILLTRMIETESDIVSCDALRVWEDHTPSRNMIRINGNYILNKTEAMKALIQSTCQIQTVWNKLYKRAVIKDIPFEKGKIHEDEFWSWKVFAMASRVATVEEALYYYSQRNDGIMGKGYSGSPLSVVEARQQRHDYIMNNMPELADIDSESLLGTCYYQGIQVIRYESGIQKQRYLKQLENATAICEFSDKYISESKTQQKLRILLLKKHFRFTCHLAVLRGVK